MKSGPGNYSSRAESDNITPTSTSTQIETTLGLDCIGNIESYINITPNTYLSPMETVTEIVKLLGNPANCSWEKVGMSLSLSDPAAYLIPIQATQYNSCNVANVSADDFYFAMVVMSNERIDRKSSHVKIRDRLKPRRDAIIHARQSFLNELRCSPDVVSWDALDDRCLRYMVYIYLMSQNNDSSRFPGMGMLQNVDCSRFPGMSMLQGLHWTTDPKVACLILPHPRDVDISASMPIGMRSRQDLKDIELFMHGGEYDALKLLQQLRETIRSVPGPIDAGLTCGRKIHSADIRVNDKLYWGHPDGDEEQRRNRAAVYCKRSELERVFTMLGVSCSTTIPTFVTEITKGNNCHGFKVARSSDQTQVEDDDYFVFFKVSQAEQLYTSVRIFHPFARSESAQLFPWKLIVSRDLHLDIPVLDSIIQNSKPASEWFPDVGITNAVVIPDYFGFKFFSPQKKVRALFDDKNWPVNLLNRLMKTPEVLEIERRKKRDSDRAKKIADNARDEEKERERGRSDVGLNCRCPRDRDSYRDFDRDCCRNSRAYAGGAVGGYFTGNRRGEDGRKDRGFNNHRNIGILGGNRSGDRRVCRYFQRNQCRRGSSCPFTHSLVKTISNTDS